ncbi:MAG: heavy-metal-associated domain-containing protein [Microthrixaceae bacterium]|nr:heavy-metal-associated domain-containing protein [Microthrixaceae bacterium]
MAEVETFEVVGMTCQHCVAAVTEELSGLPGVIGVDVDLGTGRASVTSTEPVPGTQIDAAVAEAGYEVRR